MQTINVNGVNKFWGFQGGDCSDFGLRGLWHRLDWYRLFTSPPESFAFHIHYPVPRPEFEGIMFLWNVGICLQDYAVSQAVEGCRSSSALDLYSGGACFQSRLEHRLFCLKIFVIFLSPSTKYWDIISVSPQLLSPKYSVIRFLWLVLTFDRACGSVVGWGTVLQAGRSRDRVPMR
jgi:hypothetical protein